jgi:hypothetical protein
MWLLDANMDVHLASILTALGIECDTAGNRGWKALSNGNLVKAAVDAGFRRLLTRDRLFGEICFPGAQAFPHFAVVVVNIPQFVAHWRECPIEPVAGYLTNWP